MHLEKSGIALAAASAPQEPTKPHEPGVFSRHNLAVAVLVLSAIIFLLLFAKLCNIPLHPRHGTRYNYFAAQADAWLHGRWDVITFFHLDQVVLHGKYYSIYGPFPALLMLPLVAVLGANVSDVLFTIALSATNLGLLFLLFEQLRASGLTQRSWRENALWSVLLYIGSTALFLSLDGKVWFTWHIVACACLLVSLLLAFRRHFVWSAVALGCAFFSRPTLLLGFPFLFYLAWQDGGEMQLVGQFLASVWARRPDWRAVPWRRLSGVLAVLAACLVLYGVRNWAMFGNSLENGYTLQLVQYYSAVVTHGVNSPAYIPVNLLNDFFNFPHIDFQFALTTRPQIDLVNDRTDISVFLTTPLFLLLFWRNKNKQHRWLRAALWASILLLMAFVLTFYSAGHPQFGTRYLFDLYPYAWVLLALSEVRTDWRFVALGIIAVVFNILGSFQYWAHASPFTLPPFLG